MKKIIIRIVGVIALLFVIIWFGGRILLSTSTADYSGEIKIAGLSNPVEITFDSKAIPQVWAKTNSDMYFSLGWLHASERLFQMELVRRLVEGRLSEVFGNMAFDMDKYQRIIGFYVKANNDIKDLSPSDLKILQDYCNGINRWIEYKSILPPEFILLGLTPEKWKPEDCLAIFLYQTWFAHSLVDHDVAYNKLFNKLGKRLGPLFSEYLKWSPPTVHDSFIKKIFGENSPQFQMSLASNSWVVSGAKSKNGKPMHASDPHLAINSFPGFWYIAGLHSEEGINILGITTPGIPIVVMGHNQTSAFAFTVASLDLVDYYIEKKNPEDSLQVLSPDGYKELKITKDSIFVKDQDIPKYVNLIKGINGPVVETDSAFYVTLKWAGFDFNVSKIFESSVRLQTVNNFSDFRQIVIGFGALDVNWTYSDKNGNIGYQLGAPIPLRNYSNSFVRLPAENKDYHWLGYRKLNETPYMRNPQNGWLATCNNQIVSDNWKYDIPGYYDPYRIIRINELLKSKKKFSVSDFQKYQMDRISGKAIQWKELMLSGAKALNDASLVRRIKSWNGSVKAGSKTGGLFELWIQFLTEEIFEDNLGNNWQTANLIMDKFLTNPIHEIVDNNKTIGKVETLIDNSAAALEKAKMILKNRTYGDICSLTIVHPLAQVKILNYWLNLNRGPFINGGDAGSLNSNFIHFNKRDNTFNSVVGPSMRFVLDWSDVDAFTINTNTGQSGNPLNAHYDDFIQMMRKGQRWNVPFSKGKVYAVKSSLLKLLPEK